MEENIEKNEKTNNKVTNNSSESSTANNEKIESHINKNDLKTDINETEQKVIKKEINDDNSKTIKNELKPQKALPIEKKPFGEFINNHLIPTLIDEFNQKGYEIGDINLKNTLRPIAEDKCWVVYCEIKDTCNFWLSFEEDNITSSKSISLSKPNLRPSIIESFLIDEKRITLNLIISRILQRLNGQKLIGIN